MSSYVLILITSYLTSQQLLILIYRLDNKAGYGVWVKSGQEELKSSILFHTQHTGLFKPEVFTNIDSFNKCHFLIYS